MSSFHLTHPTLITSYLHVIALIICNLLYFLGFIGSFYILFFSSSYFLFFISFFFSVFIFPPFLSILFFLFLFFILFTSYFHFYLLYSYILLSIIFFFFLFSFFLILYLEGNALLIIMREIPFSFFILICFFVFSFFSPCLFSYLLYQSYPLYHLCNSEYCRILFHDCLCKTIHYNYVIKFIRSID